MATYTLPWVTAAAAVIRRRTDKISKPGWARFCVWTLTAIISPATRIATTPCHRITHSWATRTHWRRSGHTACAIPGAAHLTGVTGDFFIADVGQNSWEEINFQPAASTGGENYGWDVLEGMHCYEDIPQGSCTQFLTGGSTLPVLEYSHSLGCSVTGGYRYRGQTLSAARWHILLFRSTAQGDHLGRDSG